jgi:hypothetical protein
LAIALVLRASGIAEMEVLRCAHCRDVIGVYEPAWVILDDGRELRGSWLTLGAELETPGSTAVHEGCYGELRLDRQNR